MQEMTGCCGVLGKCIRDAIAMPPIAPTSPKGKLPAYLGTINQHK